MKAVLLDQQTLSADISLTAIEHCVSSITCYPVTHHHEILPRCIDTDIIITNKVVIGDDLMAQLPQLKLICIAATGTNNVDLAAAKKRGIAVTNVSGYSTPAVTQYVFAQMLEFYSQTSHHNKNTDDGLWQQSETFCYLGNNIVELSGKTLGIIGYGNLGRAVESVALAFGMQVLIAERANSKRVRSGRHSFDQVMKNADVITLHCPHTSETEALINTKSLQLMKSTAMLINTARGAVVDNHALLAALAEKRIAYAALDVLDVEPPSSDHILIKSKLDNLKITAHIAWASMQAQQRLVQGIADNIESFKEGKQRNRVE